MAIDEPGEEKKAEREATTGPQSPFRQVAHAEAHHQLCVDERGEPDTGGEDAEIDGEKLAGAILLLEDLLRGAEIADEGAEDAAGRQRIADRDAVSDRLARRTQYMPEREGRPVVGHARL